MSKRQRLLDTFREAADRYNATEPWFVSRYSPYEQQEAKRVAKEDMERANRALNEHDNAVRAVTPAYQRLQIPEIFKTYGPLEPALMRKISHEMPRVSGYTMLDKLEAEELARRQAGSGYGVPSLEETLYSY